LIRFSDGRVEIVENCYELVLKSVHIVQPYLPFI
jgi:hypothetical protein